MITVKRLISLTLVCLLFLSLFACSSENDDLHSLLNQGSGEEYSEPAAAYDVVVVPATAGNALITRARTLCADLTARTGIPASFFFDNETLPKQDNVRFILLGNTSHTLSEKHLDNLRRDDYLCALDEGVLILGGKSDSATLAAIERFSTELLPYADAEILFNADQQFLVSAQYPISAITLNDFSLDDYRIVYPKNNTLGEAQIASALREAIADRCGYYPDILADNKVSEYTRILAIGACFDQESAPEPSVIATNSVITLHGATQYELCASAQALCDYLFPDNAPTEISASLRAPIPVPCSSPVLSTFVGSFLETDTDTHVSSIASACAALRQSDADLAPFFPATESSMRYLQENLSKFLSVSVPLSTDRSLPLFYREDRLSLIEQTVDGNVSILRFQIRDTELYFTLIHTFADNAEAVQQAIEKSALVNEPALLVLMIPSSLSVVGTETSVLGELHVSANVKTYLLCSPSKAIVKTNANNALFTFTFTHPFLLK